MREALLSRAGEVVHDSPRLRLFCAWLLLCIAALFVSSNSFNPKVVSLKQYHGPTSSSSTVEFKMTKPDPDLIAMSTSSLPVSGHHCYGSHMQENSAWFIRNCHYKNLCLNVETKEIFYLVNKKKDNLTLEPCAVSAMFDAWTPKADFPGLQFAPKTITREELVSIDSQAYVYPQDEIITMYQAFISHNVGHIFLEDYMIWFLNAAVIAGGTGEKYSIRPLWRNSPVPEPPWFNCDWFRLHTGPGHSILSKAIPNTCTSHHVRFLPGMLGPGNTIVRETGDITHWRHDIKLHCFPNLVIGAGSTRNAIGGHDHWDFEKSVPPAMFGRAPLLFDMRSMIMRNVGLDPLAGRFQNEIHVVFSSFSSKRESLDFSVIAVKLQKHLAAVDLAGSIESLTNRKNLTISVADVQLKDYDLKEQIALVSSQPTVFVTAGGGGAFSGWFLPPGSSMILLSTAYRNDDWKAYGSMYWFRALYKESNLTQYDENLEKFFQLVSNEVVACALFSSDF